MSSARVCDGCGRVQTERPYEGWFALQEDDGSYRSIFSAEQPPQSFHVCSWRCVADLGIQKADLFSEPKEVQA